MPSCRELGNPPVPVITTVHSIQVVEEEIPFEPFDLTVDWIVTEREAIATRTPYPKPTGIDWERVTDEELRAMPVLEEIRSLIRSRQAGFRLNEVPGNRIGVYYKVG